MLDLNSPYTNCDHLTLGDYLTFTFTTDKARKFERQLYDSKWWDYRFMTPIEATMEFIEAYCRVAPVVYAREIDFERGKEIRPTRSEAYAVRLQDLGKEKAKDAERLKKNFSGHWRARSVSDAIGMRYDDYIEIAMGFRMRNWKVVGLPPPTHLYGEIDVNKTIERWAELQTSRIYFADHYAYMPENWRGTPAQLAYTEYLVERARARSVSSDRTLFDMIEDGKISPTGLKQVIGADEYERIVRTQSH